MTAESPLVGRLAPLIVAVILLTGSPPASSAPIIWPADGETLGRTGDFLRHMVAVATAVRIESVSLREPHDLHRVYRDRDFRPIWIGADGVSVEAGDLLARLEQAELDGLDSGAYRTTLLRSRLELPAEDPGHLAQLELLLSDAFLHFARHLSTGRVEPGEVDPEWLIEPPVVDRPAALAQVAEGMPVVDVLEALTPTDTQYRRLRQALARYRAVERRGGWPAIGEGPLLKRGQRDERVPDLRWRLASVGDLAESQVRDEHLYTLAVEQAVRRFQRRHGLDPDGMVGEQTRQALNIPVEARIRQILINMERWRWLPREVAGRYIMVNVAGFELIVFEDGMPIKEMPVIIGRDQRRTPAIRGQLDTLVLNPYWYIPPTLFREDLLPSLQRDPGVLQRLRLRVFSSLEGQGVEVDPGTIDWKRVDPEQFNYVLRQDPGPDNALGRYKFLFPNEHNIYLHDTAERALFRRDVRAYSSGCVRVAEPEWLADYLLADELAWGDRAVRQVVEQQRPTSVSLAGGVPIYLVYWTAWVDELNQLNFRNDIYQRDRLLKRRLTVN